MRKFLIALKGRLQLFTPTQVESVGNPLTPPNEMQAIQQALTGADFWLRELPEVDFLIEFPNLTSNQVKEATQLVKDFNDLAQAQMEKMLSSENRKKAINLLSRLEKMFHTQLVALNSVQ